VLTPTQRPVEPCVVASVRLDAVDVLEDFWLVP
jgi:hypothetical protein